MKPAFLVSFATLHPCLADSFASSRILMRSSKAISSHSGSSIISRSLSPIALMQNCLNRSKSSSVSMARHPCPPGVGSPDMAGMLRAPLEFLPAPDRRRFLRMRPRAVRAKSASRGRVCCGRRGRPALPWASNRAGGRWPSPSRARPCLPSSRSAPATTETPAGGFPACARRRSNTDPSCP